MKVLVIEDDQKISNLLQQALEAEGWTGLFFSSLDPLTIVQLHEISDVDLIFWDRMVGDLIEQAFACGL